MRPALGLAGLLMVLAGCAGKTTCPSEDALKQRWLDRGEQGLAFSAVGADSHCGVPADQQRQAWLEGRQRYCGQAGNGWLRGALEQPTVSCENPAFQAAERMGRQWRNWLEERRELIAAIESSDKPAEQRQLRLRQQRLERDLDMLRGIAATRGYPMEAVPDWREPEQMPQPESSP